MTEIEKLVIDYNIDSKNSRIIEYYEADSIWKTLRIERDENRHSAFIAWMLKKDFNSIHSPLYKLLNLLMLRMDDSLIENEELPILKKNILYSKLGVKSINVELEKQICSLSRIRYKDRLDIYLLCEITGIEQYSHLEIIIENKVDSNEGIGKELKLNQETAEEKEYKKKSQTERYYYACSKSDGLRNDSLDKSKTLQLFVYLSPREQCPIEKKFIKISYQDLVDYVLEPYLEKDNFDEHTRIAIKEYLRNLGNPFNYNMSTMAITTEETQLLIDFYTRNEMLFKKALEVMRDNAESEEEQKNYTSMLETIAKNKKVHRFFTINNSSQQYKMYEVVAEFVKFKLSQLEPRTSIEEKMKAIENEIAEYSKRKKPCNVSLNKDDVVRPEKCFTSEYNGIPFYVTREWGLTDNGKNFSGILQNIEKNYPSFRVTML